MAADDGQQIHDHVSQAGPVSVDSLDFVLHVHHPWPCCFLLDKDSPWPVDNTHTQTEKLHSP
jgi:hypothetical protein